LLRRGAVFALITIALVVALVTTAVAYFVDWLPEQASEERQGIDLVFYVTVGICIFVFAVVAAISIYAALKFRVRPDDDSDGSPIHGHTGIEIVWTAVPTILVTVIAVLSAVVLAQNDRSKGTVNRVDVLAQQFAWQFTYRDQGNAKSTQLYLPIGRSTRLLLHSRDVIHSFWVPEFGQKQDIVPGIVTSLVITPTKLGEYRIICTELCGLGHALMRSRAIVLSEADFRAWARKQRRFGGTGTATTGQATTGETATGQTATGETTTGATTTRGGTNVDVKGVFASNCGGCHTLAKAGTTGTVGPNLTTRKVAPDRAEDQIRHGGGGMPPFEGQLSDDEIEALVQYLTGSK